VGISEEDLRRAQQLVDSAFPEEEVPVAEILTLPPEVRFLTTQIPPPSPFYLARDDVLEVVIFNSVGGNLVSVGTRWLNPNGEVVPEVFTFSPTSDRVANRFTVPAKEGYLLGLHLGATLATQPGQCYVRIGVTRPGLLTGAGLHTLLAAYVTDAYRPSWPTTPPRSSRDGPGTIYRTTGSAPTAGAETSITVPTGALWRVLAAMFTLTTSATVANRVVRFTAADGPTDFYRTAGNYTQGASETIDYVAGEIGVAGSVGGNIIHLPLPEGLLLRAGHSLQTRTLNLQATDQFSALSVLVEEWIAI